MQSRLPEKKWDRSWKCGVNWGLRSNNSIINILHKWRFTTKDDENNFVSFLLSVLSLSKCLREMSTHITTPLNAFNNWLVHFVQIKFCVSIMSCLDTLNSISNISSQFLSGQIIVFTRIKYLWLEWICDRLMAAVLFRVPVCLWQSLPPFNL